VAEPASAPPLPREGAKVTITGRRKEILGEIADAIAAAGGHALAVPGSVTDEADVQHAVQATLARFGNSSESSMPAFPCFWNFHGVARIFGTPLMNANFSPLIISSGQGFMFNSASFGL